VRFSEEDASNSTSDISESLLYDYGHPEIPAVPEPDPTPFSYHTLDSPRRV
jgi:hypothetical protein